MKRIVHGLLAEACVTSVCSYHDRPHTCPGHIAHTNAAFSIVNVMHTQAIKVIRLGRFKFKDNVPKLHLLDAEWGEIRNTRWIKDTLPGNPNLTVIEQLGKHSSVQSKAILPCL
jgi:hypothetical protein